MSKFRKKPVVIDAIQFNGNNGHEIERWAEGGVDYMENPIGVFYMQIVTPEGTMRGDAGDWIIRGVKGELYPCKPDIFGSTYESADIPETPLLGLATTRQLLAEISARLEMSGALDYRTIDSD